MNEQRTKVSTHMVRLRCKPGCSGELLPTGMALLSDPPHYPHKCTQCGYEFTPPAAGIKYPYTEYVEE